MFIMRTVLPGEKPIFFKACVDVSVNFSSLSKAKPIQGIMRYFLECAYDGTGFGGWQRQPNAPSIQQCIEEALSIVLKTETSVTGAGRTDAGVHARCMPAHFDTVSSPEPYRLIHALNAILEPRIAILDLYPVRDDAHARFSAIDRTYDYMITRRKNPFLIDKAYHYSGNLALEQMTLCCEDLLAHRDFACFSKAHSDVGSYLCHVMEAEWKETDDCLIFTIKANRFLRNMVRAIVGTMLEVGRKKMDRQAFREVLNSGDRSQAGWSVPAKGLYLTRVNYPPEIRI